MTEIGKRLILKKIVGKRAEGLSVLARGAGQRGFTASLSEMIEELKSYRGTPENLKEAASIVDDSYLSKKLEDLGWKALFSPEDGIGHTVEILKQLLQD